MRLFYKSYLTLIISLMASSAVHAHGKPTPSGPSLASTRQSQGPMFASKDNGSVEINNRILCKVNGKSISVMDVVKKMDLLFYREFPEYADSTAARFQFYTNSWKPILQDLIDKELIVADAEEMKMDVSNGDIRQDMEEAFGPNVMGTLDQIGLSYDEAWDMLRTDIIIRRMMFARVNMKAMAKVHPKQVRDAYAEAVGHRQEPDTWLYQVLTLRSEDEELGAAFAQDAYERLRTGSSSLESISDDLLITSQVADSEVPTLSVKVSELFEHPQSGISPEYLKTLTALTPGNYSSPVLQRSRASNSAVHRIFLLKEIRTHEAPSFSEMEEELKNQILDIALREETTRYINHLHKHFAMNDAVLQEYTPADFQPFIIN